MSISSITQDTQKVNCKCLSLCILHRMSKLIFQQYQIFMQIFGCILSVIFLVSLLQVIFKCCHHMVTYWWTCCQKDTEDHLENISRQLPKPIAHSFEIEWAPKRPGISKHIDSAHGSVEIRHPGYLEHRKHRHKHGEHHEHGGNSEGFVEALDKISSSSSDDSDYLEYYSSQSLDADTQWEMT